MNPSHSGIFPYVGRFPPWLEWWSTQFDFAWFLALLGWGLVLVLWWWQPRRTAPATPAWAWLPWSAASGLLSAATIFVVVHSGQRPMPKLAGDMVLGCLMLAATAGWCWQATRDRHRMRRVIGTLAVLPLAAIALWRYDHPLPAGWCMVAAAILAVVPWWRVRGMNAWSHTALVLAALIPLFSSVGPLAIESRLFQRHTIFNAGALLAGVFHALTATIALVGYARDSLRTFPVDTRRRFWREARPFVIGASIWVVAGTAVATWIGVTQRATHIRFAFEPIQRVADQMPPELLARTLGPEFQLDRRSMPMWRGPSAVHRAHSPHLASGVGTPLQLVLDATGRSSRGGLKAVNLLTLRDGWLVVVLSSAPRSGPGEVRIARPATSRDQANWERKAEVFEGPISFNSGGHDFYRLPLSGPDDHMLGWLEFAQARGPHDTAGMHKRTTPFACTALGLVVAALFFGQHHHIRGREAALRAAAIAAESARLKTDFLAKVSHELRTPLQNILGFGRLLEGEIATDVGRARLAAQRQQGELMLRLVNDLIDLNAVEAGVFRLVPKPTDVATSVQQSVASLQDRATAKGLTLHCTIAPGFPAWLATDPERLRQIVLNLVGNAVKFTSAGRVDVALRVVAEAPLMIELGVRDTGPGVPPDDRSKLFQSFSRLALTAEQEGSGLGLALVAAICRSAGGSVAMESDGRTGSHFRVRLPMTLAESPKRAEQLHAAGLRGRRILVADDNALVRELFGSYLRELGATCDFVADGRQAITHVLAAPYDALVLDLAMPHLGGLEVARQVRARLNGHARVRIVGVSAHASADDRAAALAAGMDEFLGKPVELSALATALSLEPPMAGERAELQARLGRIFRAELGNQITAIESARERRDWAALKAQAHHLKSSAGVVGDLRLYAECATLEDAADQADAHAAKAAWEACNEALRRWRN